MLSFLLACATGPLPAPDTAAPATASVAVSPAALDFGDVWVDAPQARTLLLINTGALPLDLTLAAADGAFTFDDTATLGAGESTELVVTFAPTDDTHRETTLAVSEGSSLLASVPLSGTGQQTALSAAPATIDLGEVRVGCLGRAPLTLTNTGDGPVTLTSASASAPFDASWGEVDFPITLAEGETLTGAVLFSPTEAGAFTGQLSAGAASVPIQATATDERLVEEIVAYQEPQVDLLMAIDRSSTLWDPVVDDLGALLQPLAESGLDYQIALVIRDSGCVTDWLEDGQSETEAEAAFRSMSAAQLGAYTEMGFTLLDAALSETDSGCNVGLLRDGSALQVLGFSDEPEQSSGSWRGRVETLRAYDAGVVVHAWGGPSPGGCGSHEAYLGFNDAAALTGGLSLSLCDDSADNLATLGERLAEVGALRLSEPADLGSVSVHVDGESWTGPLHLDATGSLLWFTDEHPEAGASVTVSYLPAGSCD